jgi:4-alpha-glucanotransferase
MSNLPAGIRPLYQLAKSYGVQTAYRDVSHRRRQASAEALLAVLQSLGAPLKTLRDVPAALRERRQELWRRLLEPVTIVWDDNPTTVPVRLPATIAEGTTLAAHLALENDEEMRWQWHAADMPLNETAVVEGVQYAVKKLALPGGLPWGYHRLSLELPARREEALVIAAPLKAYVPSEQPEDRLWGAFMPLHALHTEASWGSGNFSDLEALVEWLAGVGGGVVGTLPLLAMFLDSTSDPSPYLPISRLLWNEFYLDVTSVPELQECPSARSLMTSSSFREEVEALLGSHLVDYGRQMALKRQVLSELSRCFFEKASDRLAAFRRFMEANPLVEDYARFRAAGEKRHTRWQSWPQPLQDGLITEGDYDEESRRYHLYVQWLAHEQMAALAEKASQQGVRLYLDLPLGVHPDGYDAWRQCCLFVPDASVGAPPDVVFTRGQDWECPPPHPEKAREQGYKYTIDYLRHHLRHAGILRIDHVMGLHRLFWIPKGMEPGQGVYVHYPAHELYAILALESRRSQAILVGEDLGTVPPEVRPAMKRHGLHRMYVVHYELACDPQRALPRVSSDSVASLNTHDMTPFAGFWQGLDIEERLKLGLVDRKGAIQERRTSRTSRESLVTFLRNRGWIKERVVDTRAVLKGCLAFLSASRARAVLVSLEDLWLETQPQNVPGIKKNYPNWQRKARYGLEEFCQMPQVLDILQLIDHLRKHGS